MSNNNDEPIDQEAVLNKATNADAKAAEKKNQHEKGGPPPARPGHRQYDRQSASGKTKSTKKQGGGRYNWGKEEEAQELAELDAEAAKDGALAATAEKALKDPNAPKDFAAPFGQDPTAEESTAKGSTVGESTSSQ